MKTLTTESKTTQTYPAQQTHDNLRPKQVSSSTPTHDDIAKRAYEIYIKKGCRQGQCERNWQQAEKDMSNERKA